MRDVLLVVAFGALVAVSSCRLTSGGAGPAPSASSAGSDHETVAERCERLCAAFRERGCKSGAPVCAAFGPDGSCCGWQTCEAACVMEPEAYDASFCR